MSEKPIVIPWTRTTISLTPEQQNRMRVLMGQRGLDSRRSVPEDIRDEVFALGGHVVTETEVWNEQLNMFVRPQDVSGQLDND